MSLVRIIVSENKGLSENSTILVRDRKIEWKMFL